MLKNALMTGAVVATLALGAASASAQTTDASSTPGAPNTGAGGAATQNILILVGSALAVVGGTAYLSRRVITR